jgi:hypothetical protein
MCLLLPILLVRTLWGVLQTAYTGEWWTNPHLWDPTPWEWPAWEKELQPAVAAVAPDPHLLMAAVSDQPFSYTAAHSESVAVAGHDWMSVVASASDLPPSHPNHMGPGCLAAQFCICTCTCTCDCGRRLGSVKWPSLTLCVCSWSRCTPTWTPGGGHQGLGAFMPATWQCQQDRLHGQNLGQGQSPG